MNDETYFKVLGLEEAHFNFKDISQSFKDQEDKKIWENILNSETPTKI